MFSWMPELPFLLCGGNTLDRYTVKLYSRASRDLDNIYFYIAHNLLAPGTAVNMADALEEVIYSLEELPERGAIRQTGIYRIAKTC